MRPDLTVNSPMAPAPAGNPRTPRLFGKENRVVRHISPQPSDKPIAKNSSRRNPIAAKRSLLRRPITVGLLGLVMVQLACSVTTQALGATTPSGSTLQLTQTASPAPSNCQNDLFPVKSGATWTYTGQFSKNSYTRVFTITSIAPDSFQGRTQISDGSGSTLVDTTDAWQCTNEGLVEQAGPLGATLQSAYAGATMKTLSTTGVTIPVQIKSGDTWNQVSKLEFTSGQQTNQSTLSYEFTAFGSEQVVVPAGTFNAVKVQVHATTQAVLQGQTVDVTISGFEWFAPGVGHVKSSETVYAFGIPFASEEGQLQSYKIP